jgi:hypothetical protein
MTDLAKLTDAIAQGRRTGSEPIGIRGIEIDFPTALKVQAAVLKQLIASGESLGGWKVGMTSGNARHGGEGFQAIRLCSEISLVQLGRSGLHSPKSYGTRSNRRFASSSVRRFAVALRRLKRKLPSGPLPQHSR